MRSSRVPKYASHRSPKTAKGYSVVSFITYAVLAAGAYVAAQFAFF